MNSNIKISSSSKIIYKNNLQKEIKKIRNKSEERRARWSRRSPRSAGWRWLSASSTCFSIWWIQLEVWKSRKICKSRPKTIKKASEKISTPTKTDTDNKNFKNHQNTENCAKLDNEKTNRPQRTWPEMKKIALLALLRIQNVDAKRGSKYKGIYWIFLYSHSLKCVTYQCKEFLEKILNIYLAGCLID